MLHFWTSPKYPKTRLYLVLILPGNIYPQFPIFVTKIAKTSPVHKPTQKATQKKILPMLKNVCPWYLLLPYCSNCYWPQSRCKPSEGYPFPPVTAMLSSFWAMPVTFLRGEGWLRGWGNNVLLSCFPVKTSWTLSSNWTFELCPVTSKPLFMLRCNILFQVTLKARLLLGCNVVAYFWSNYQEALEAVSWKDRLWYPKVSPMALAWANLPVARFLQRTGALIWICSVYCLGISNHSNSLAESAELYSI